MLSLARIQIFPVKSLDPVVVERAQVLPSGALAWDRRYALFDEAGKFVNGKRTPRVHTLRTTFDLPAGTITLTTGGAPRTFRFQEDRRDLERFLGDHLGLAVTLRENVPHGFPDDTDSPGPTVVGAATLEAVAGWFPGLTLDEVRLRFRANLEIAGEEPFWEDRLFGEEGDAIPFRVGAVEFAGTNPCQRCVVPTRSSRDGTRTPEFTRLFETRRFETLPYWTTRSRFDHFYRLAVNTRLVSNEGGWIALGNEVRLVESARAG
jgi:uncharacterized protein YcbX